MALKALMLRKKINDARQELEELRKKEADFETREAELEGAINEAKTDEEKATVEEAVEAFEGEKNAYEDKKEELERSISELEAELAGLEKEAPGKKEPEERKDKKMNNVENRTKFFGMAAHERDAFFARADVKEFLQRVRELGMQKREITGSELLIPTVMLDLVRENIESYSKLIKHVNLQRVPGKARQNVMGTIPEAVWTEACGVLNELSLSFNQEEVDGYKVGGFIAICNATLEDSDINLASEIISALGKASGYAVDKAILYGTGTKMPLGVVTRLCQTAQPSDYPANARAWANLSTTNVISIAASKTGAEFFAEIITASSKAKSKYSRGAKFWAMNETTYATMVNKLLSINASGAIVTGMNATMPIVGGAIELLDFIPDNVIIGGYGDLYLLAERAGTAIARSTECRFVEDQTVFKGTARYDGKPVIADGFVAIGIAGTKPAASAVTFAPDTANTPGTGD